MGNVGFGGTSPAVAATGDTHSGAGLKLYTWTTVRKKVFIQNNAAVGGTNLYIRVNAATASTTDYDVKLVPGAHFLPFAGGELITKQIAIWADDALNYKHATGFIVIGWE